MAILNYTFSFSTHKFISPKNTARSIVRPFTKPVNFLPPHKPTLKIHRLLAGIALHSTFLIWIRNYRDHEEKSFVGSGNSINQEMRELKRKLYLVRQERDILKKAVAIFSAPQSKGTNL